MCDCDDLIADERESWVEDQRDIEILHAAELAALRAEVERLRAEVAYIVALLDPLVGGDGAPVQALVRRIAARASASAGAIPSGEAVR